MNPLVSRPAVTSNAFSALDTKPANLGPVVNDNMLDFMNSFAHKVQVGKKQMQKTKKPKEDVDRVLKEFCPNAPKFINPLPDDLHEINRLAALCPSSEEEPLEPGEMWVLFDTGASCNAFKIKRDSPEYAHLVKPTAKSQTGQGAETACGGSIRERGEVTIDLLVDGIYHQLPVRDMDVSMPISSGRSCVSSSDNYAVIHKNGGTLKNITTGKEIALYGRQGVFFFKAKVLPPGSIDPDTELPFARRG